MAAQKREIVEIATAIKGSNDAQTASEIVTVALCNDNSVWIISGRAKYWDKLPDISQEGYGE